MLIRLTHSLPFALRSPLLGGMLSLVLLASVPAHAMLLKGYLKQEPKVPTLNTDVLDSSFPISYEGIWQCTTYVYDSSVVNIEPGETVTSTVTFKKSADGRVKAEWQEPGWSESCVNVKSQEKFEASSERMNYYLSPNSSDSLAAYSHDLYRQVSLNQMLAMSYVDQYLDGKWQGRYRTKSVLHRISGPDHLAFFLP